LADEIERVVVFAVTRPCPGRSPSCWLVRPRGDRGRATGAWPDAGTPAAAVLTGVEITSADDTDWLAQCSTLISWLGRRSTRFSPTVA